MVKRPKGFTVLCRCLPDIPAFPVFPDFPVFQISPVSPEFPDCPGLLDSLDYLVSAIFLITFILPYPMPVIFFSFFVQTTFSYYFCLYYSRFDACFILFAPVISRFYKNLSNFLFNFGGEYKKVTIFAQEILSLKRETTLFQS